VIAACAAALLATLAAPWRPAGAQGETGARADSGAAVAGVVRGAAGAVLVGAEVTLTPVRAEGSAGSGMVFGRRVFTDESGRFRVAGLPGGRVTVAARRIGYRPATTEVVAPTAAPVEVTLEPVPQSLATVVVRDRAGGRTDRGWATRFYERKERGMGRYVTRQEIDRRNPIRTTDMLRTIPGVQVMPGPGGFGYVLRVRGSRCDPLVWIDGAPAFGGYLDVDAFQPQSLEGIEVYSGPSTVPVELRGPRGEDACGVIALWTRVPEPRRPKKSITADELAALVASATVYTEDQVDEPARADTTKLIQPFYPDSLRAARVEGGAIVEFVVDTLGVPEAATVGIVAASHPAFGDAVRNAARGARFTPALRQGRRVRQVVQVPVRFEVEGR
jgi:TonB family protein